MTCTTRGTVSTRRSTASTGKPSALSVALCQLASAVLVWPAILFAVSTVDARVIVGPDGATCSLTAFAMRAGRVNAACCPPNASCAAQPAAGAAHAVTSLPETCAAHCPC